MQRHSWLLAVLVLASLFRGSVAQGADPLPRSLDPRLKIELFAENPQIATPTGIDVDHQGRVWAIESNTHFPPEGYQGHKTDRLLVMQDADGDGRADEITVFADGLTHAMSVAVRPVWFPVPAKKSDKGEIAPPKLSVYVATRREILLLHDDDGDLKADRRERLVHLETTGNYPHNGLAGFAFDAMGWMFFGFGENLGADYQIIGSDGTTLKGGGEGGSIYRTRLDGSRLSRWSTGFWNPHASCIDGYGRMFSVDNDPDSRPPCRLLHIVPDGDYGYRFRNGRKGLHPFTAWNGEIPGTLPMVAGTGEAPSGIVAYESDGFPADYVGNLLVGSWGDHRIDRFKLKGKGASFTSLAEPLITGDENFRPVGLAIAPDGSLYCTDWVSREYKLHGKGRVWRISTILPRAKPPVLMADIQKASEVQLFELLNASSGPVQRAAAYYLGKSVAGRSLLVTQFADSILSSRSRLEAFWAAANLALEPEPPTDLLVNVRSLSATFSRTNPNTTAAFGSSRSRGEADNPVTDEVQCASLWLRGTNPSESIFYNQVVTLGSRSAGWLRSRNEASSSLALAGAIARRNEVSPYAGNSDRWHDPFLLSAYIHSLVQGESPEMLRKWFAELEPKAPAQQDGVLNRDEARELIARLPDATPEQRAIVLEQLRARRPGGAFGSPQRDASLTQPTHIAMVLVARQRFPKDQELIAFFLKHTEPLARRLVVQWIAEEKLKELRPQVEAILSDPALNSELFLSTLAALEMLDGVDPVEFDKTPASKYVLPLVQKDGPPTVRALALQMASPSDSALTADLYKKLLSSPDERLRLETIRTLQLSPLPEAADMLVAIAGDAAQPDVARAEAIAGLATAVKASASDNSARKVLFKILLGDKPVLTIEALRTLRGVGSSGQANLAIKHLVDNLPPMDERVLNDNERPGRNPDAAAFGVARPGAMPTLNSELREQALLAMAGPKEPGNAESATPPIRIRSISEWYQIAGISNVNLDRAGANGGLGGGPGGIGGAGGFGAAGGFGGRGGRGLAIANSDPAAGRRVFFHANSAGCAKCHTVDGRGGKVGPELTTIARTMDRTKLVQSILEPSREMSPQFVSWNFELTSGRVLTGLLLSEESEKLKIGTADAKVHELTLKDIETRAPQSMSLMPEKLADQLTAQEFLDLIAFLESLK